MKIFAGLIVAASATVDRIITRKGWPANTDAPYCGCQIIIDPNQPQYGGASGYDGGHINGTCTLRFPYADESRYGRLAAADPHFVSVAGSYMLGRNREDNSPDGFHFTGFDQVSPPDVLDILVFYENQDCAREGRDVSEIPDLPQDQIWEVYNLTESQTEGLCEFVLECQPNGGDADYPVAHSGVYLGNFNYDIARSVQTYTVPIYGLAQDQTVTFPITNYYNGEADCINPLAHHGHGTASGCSQDYNSTGECSNEVTFHQNPDHNGLLEYFQFEPVQMNNAPQCAMPVHHKDDYQWDTPSPWDTQENYESTEFKDYPMPGF